MAIVHTGSSHKHGGMGGQTQKESEAKDSRCAWFPKAGVSIDLTATPQAETGSLCCQGFEPASPPREGWLVAQHDYQRADRKKVDRIGRIGDC
jgi:hypothetical protein